MLKVENLHAGYGGAEVLNGVNLEVKQGTVVALIGANGAGKTTTMRAISGMIRPSTGKVTLEGTEVEGYNAAKIARLGLAHSPEGRKVFGPLSPSKTTCCSAPTVDCRASLDSTAPPKKNSKRSTPSSPD